MQDQIIFANTKYPTGFDKVVSSGMFSYEVMTYYYYYLINDCGQAVTGVNVKIISHARGSSHEKATQDGLRFWT